MTFQVGHATPDQGDPTKIGGVVSAGVRTGTPLADGQRIDAWFSQYGSLRVEVAVGGSPLGGQIDGDGVANSFAAFARVNSYSMIYRGDGTWDRERTPVVFKSFASTAVVAGTGFTAWTPAAGKKFRLMGWLLSCSSAAQLIFGDNAVATIIARSEALAAAGVSKAGRGDVGNGLLSAAANNVLKIDVTLAGNVAGMVWGTEE